MTFHGSSTVRKHLFWELIGCASLVSLALTFILLYANLVRHDDALLEAISISPGVFMELVFLLCPYALSMGLPFGFCLAVLFCVGRWSAVNEITALHSLGFSSWHWQMPVYSCALCISTICCATSLFWAPSARADFDLRKREIAWNNLQRIVSDGKEFELPLEKQGSNRSLRGLTGALGDRTDRAVLSIGHAGDKEWRNLRILLLDDLGGLLSVLHAKRASVRPDRSRGVVGLNLFEVDLERLESSSQEDFHSHAFLSFEKWKDSVEISIYAEEQNSFNPKRTPVHRWKMRADEAGRTCLPAPALEHLNKSLVLGSSPLFLSFALVPLGLAKGRKEKTTNLFLGAVASLAFYLLGFVFSFLLGESGLGWWVPSFLVILVLFYKVLPVNILRH